MARAPSPFAGCIAPLARIAARARDAEGQVIWWDNGGWQAQEDDEAMLDTEEVAYYAEGLLAEGFGLHWQALAEADEPARPVLIRLFFWQPGEAPPLPDADGWHLAGSATQDAQPVQSA